jgi:hypothetical protein
MGAGLESGAEFGKQGLVSEDLAFEQQVDNSSFVKKLDGARPYDVQSLCGLCGLAQDHGACGEESDLRLPGHLA